MKREQSLNSSEILLSLAAAPFLLSLLAVKTLSERIQEIGQASEEIFRGDRLPVLHFPESDRER